MALRISGLDHIVLRVRDMDASVAFYTEVLGCRVERTLPDFGMIQIRAGEALIDLVDVEGKLGREGGVAAAAGGRNVDHFCLALESWDFPALKNYLEAHGVEVGEPRRRYGAGGFGPSVYIRDPDDNTVELKGGQ